MQQSSDYQEVLATVQELIGEVTGYDPEDILPESNLENSLQLDMEIDFPKILKKINTHLGLGLTLSDVEDITTVDGLVKVVIDELELG